MPSCTDDINRFGGFLLAVVLIFGGLCVWSIVVYRQQHCVQLFGHWLAVDRPTTLLCENPLQGFERGSVPPAKR